MKKKIITLTIVLLLLGVTACGTKNEKPKDSATPSATSETTKTDKATDNTTEQNPKDASSEKWEQKNTMYDYNFVKDGQYGRFIGQDLYVFGPKGSVEGYFSMGLTEEEGGLYYVFLSTLQDFEYEEFKNEKNVKIDKLEDILTNEVISNEIKGDFVNCVTSAHPEDITYEITNGEYVTIEGIDMYKFEGRLNHTPSDTTFSTFLYGYAFMYNNVPCQVTTVIAKYNNESDKETAEKNVKEVTDDMIHTLNTDPWEYQDNY